MNKETLMHHHCMAIPIPVHPSLATQAGGKPEFFSRELQISPEMDLVPVPGQPLPPVLEGPEDVPKELVAAAVDPLDGLLPFLTKAARNRWELPTSQAQLLVGAKARGNTFSRYGFSFWPSGRHGQETSWRVER
jgi:hypothetical protein